MKVKIVFAVVAATVLASPVFAADIQQADTQSGGLTRAQVRAELVELENVGYHVGDGDSTNYPEEIQAAEAKVAAQHLARSAVGGVAGSSTASGATQNPGN